MEDYKHTLPRLQTCLCKPTDVFMQAYKHCISLRKYICKPTNMFMQVYKQGYAAHKDVPEKTLITRERVWCKTGFPQWVKRRPPAFSTCVQGGARGTLLHRPIYLEFGSLERFGIILMKIQDGAY